MPRSGKFWEVLGNRCTNSYAVHRSSLQIHQILCTYRRAARSDQNRAAPGRRTKAINAFPVTNCGGLHVQGIFDAIPLHSRASRVPLVVLDLRHVLITRLHRRGTVSGTLVPSLFADFSEAAQSIPTVHLLPCRRGCCGPRVSVPPRRCRARSGPGGAFCSG